MGEISVGETITSKRINFLVGGINQEKNNNNNSNKKKLPFLGHLLYYMY